VLSLPITSLDPAPKGLVRPMSVASIAAEWYTSGTFWAATDPVAVILGAAAGVWVTLAVGFPRGRLYYQLQAVAPLVIEAEGMRGELELRHRGNLQADPQVVTIKLVSRGRKDITSDAFDKHQPIRLELRAPVVEVLRVTSEPDDRPTPTVTSDGTSVNIGPSLLDRRHTITITVLTDGGEPDLHCTSPVHNVRSRSGEPLTAARPVMVGAVAIVVAVGSGVAGMAAKSLPTAAGLTVVAGVVVAAVGLMVALPWIEAPSRRPKPGRKRS